MNPPIKALGVSRGIGSEESRRLRMRAGAHVGLRVESTDGREHRRDRQHQLQWCHRIGFCIGESLGMKSGKKNSD